MTPLGGPVLDALEPGPDDVSAMLDHLGARGIRRLMVEDGGMIHTQFLQADLVDEIHLAVASFFLGDPTAPRFVNSGVFPGGPQRRMRSAEVSMIGDIALLLGGLRLALAARSDGRV